MKKLIMLFALMTYAVCMSAEILSHIQIGDVCYNLDTENMTAEVTSSNSGYYWQTTIDIPASVEYNDLTFNVTSIGDSAFYYCQNLERIHFSEGLLSIGNSAFRKCEKLRSVTFPKSLLTIGGFAFHTCSYFGSIEIPNNVTSIGEYAFAWCQHVRYAIIGDGVITIERYAFAHCVEMISATMGKNIKTIGDCAFWHCEMLNSITLPSTLTYIGTQGFFYCKQLCPFSCLAVTPPTLGNEVFSGVEKRSLEVPSESVTAYKSAYQWKDFNIDEIYIDDEANENILYKSDKQTRKVVHNGQVLIECGNKTYTTNGIEIK